MAKASEKKSRIPFWAQITLILLCGVLCSVAVLLILPEIKKETHVVTFAYGDGTVIGTKEVKDGRGVMPEIYETEDVFRGWSGAINHVTADVEVHPMLYHITSADENLFYFNSVYVKEGNAFTLDLQLSGAVRISSADLTLEYDPEVMSFVQAEGGAFCSAEESEPGSVKVAFRADTPVTDKTVLAQLTFKTRRKDVLETQIDLIAENANLTQNGKNISVTVSTINNKVYFLQEVSQ